MHLYNQFWRNFESNIITLSVCCCIFKQCNLKYKKSILHCVTELKAGNGLVDDIFETVLVADLEILIDFSVYFEIFV